MSSAIASLGGPTLANWVRSVTKKKPRAASTSTPASTSSATTAQSAASGNLLGEIQQAVTTALQSAQSDGGADPNQVVEDAITKLLKNIGVGSSSATSTTPASPTSGTPTPAAPTTPPSNAANQAFVSLLQSVGISSSQFHADFQAAVRAAQRGSPNPNANLQSIPIGSSLDVTG